MIKGKKSLEKSKSLAEGITLEFDSQGNEPLNPIQAMARRLNAALEAAMQGTDEPYRVLLSNYDAEHGDEALKRLFEYIRQYCFLQTSPGDWFGMPLSFPEAVCEAVYGDPGPNASFVSYVQCPNCGYRPPEKQLIRGGRLERVRLFKRCPVCDSDLMK